MDPKQIVADGYDRIAERHAAWSRGVRIEERDRYTALLLSGLREGASVLELGCGVGIPTTKRLADRFRVLGVDISPRHVEMARRTVPNATFLLADMTTLVLPEASFDGVAAFYSVMHVPREQQQDLFAAIARWLRPGGLLMAALGARDNAGAVADDWLGAPLDSSSYDADTSRRLVEHAGLGIVSAQKETAEEFGMPTTFFWVVARKP